MFLQNEILSNRNDFEKICQDHSVRYLFGFGSSVTDHFNPEKSDIDLVVEIDEQDPVERGEKLMALWDQLEIFFRRKVDLLTDSSVKNPFLKKSIDSTKILIYDGTRQKIIN